MSDYVIQDYDVNSVGSPTYMETNNMVLTSVLRIEGHVMLYRTHEVDDFIRGRDIKVVYISKITKGD